MPLSQLKRVALVGRPNVGKSTLFNRLTRSRKAVVRDEPGVTRDIQIAETEWWGKNFAVVDTGGLSQGKTGFTPLVRVQVIEFLNATDLIILVMDGRSGWQPEDEEAFRIVRQTGKPFLLVINKCDRTLEVNPYLSDFYRWGIEPLAAAFEQDYNIDTIVEWILAHLGEAATHEREGFRLTLFGKPNVGKSSLANRLLGEYRMLVSPTPGTTVDAIETEFAFADQTYILVDTAGVRRAGSQRDGVEVLSTFKTKDAVHFTDLVLLVIDTTVGPSHQDARLIEYCLDRHKAVVVVANKVDIARTDGEKVREKFREQVAREFHFFTDIPVAFTSAKTGSGIGDLMNLIANIRQKLATRISTSQLNRFFTEVIKQAPAPVYGTDDVKFYYLTQTQQKPPSFIAFANHPEGVTPAYRRFLIHKIQEQWKLQGIPLRIFVMEKS